MKKHVLLLVVAVVAAAAAVAVVAERRGAPQPPPEHFQAARWSDPWDSTEPLIIVSAHFSEDLAWLKESPYPVVVCSKHGADAPAIPAEPRCVQPNRGRESSAYLKFIKEFYHELPKRVAFIHGHETSWHQNMDMLGAITHARKDLNYVGLNNMFYDNRDMDNPVYSEFKPTWDEHFRPYVRRELPERIVNDCCAQFIVSRTAIQRLPQEAYAHWLDIVHAVEDDYTLGQQLEFVWHIVFGELDVYPFIAQHPSAAFGARDPALADA
jgi:hypothetical protein